MTTGSFACLLQHRLPNHLGIVATFMDGSEGRHGFSKVFQADCPFADSRPRPASVIGAALTAAGRCPMLEPDENVAVGQPTAAETRRRTMIELNVKGMMCGGCAGTVEKAIKRVDADAAVTVDLASGKVRVETRADARTLGEAIEAAGYEVAA